MRYYENYLCHYGIPGMYWHNHHKKQKDKSSVSIKKTHADSYTEGKKIAAIVLAEGRKLSANEATNYKIEDEMNKEAAQINERIRAAQEHEKKTDQTRLQYLISRIFSGELSKKEMEQTINEANIICAKYGLQSIRLSDYM